MGFCSLPSGKMLPARDWLHPKKAQSNTILLASCGQASDISRICSSYTDIKHARLELAIIETLASQPILNGGRKPRRRSAPFGVMPGAHQHVQAGT